MNQLVFVNMEIDDKEWVVNFQEGSIIRTTEGETYKYSCEKASGLFANINLPNNFKLYDVVIYPINTFHYILTKQTPSSKTAKH